MREVAERYGKLFADVEQQWQTRSMATEREPRRRRCPMPTPKRCGRCSTARTRRATCPTSRSSTSSSTSTWRPREALWKLQGEVDRWLIQSPQAPPHAVRPGRSREPMPSRASSAAATRRTKGDEVPRQFLEVLSGPQSQAVRARQRPARTGPGDRRPDNPLTARVMVNRVWMHHFGAAWCARPAISARGPSRRAIPNCSTGWPAQFIADGWALKKLHRLIMLSAAYQQAVDGPTDAVARQQAASVDPENRLLWRMNRRRLSFEALRDALLAASGELDPTIGGRPVDLFDAAVPHAATLYGLIDRQFLPSMLRMFDFANPDLHIPQRSETTVPQQALFFLNHPFVARPGPGAWRKRTARSPSTDAERVAAAVSTGLPARRRRREQVARGAGVRRAAPQEPTPRSPPTVAAWQYGYGEFDEASKRVDDFHAAAALHRQGLARRPAVARREARLGAAHGRRAATPATTCEHAAVRRWTAPRDGDGRASTSTRRTTSRGGRRRPRLDRRRSRTGVLAVGRGPQPAGRARRRRRSRSRRARRSTSSSTSAPI